MRNFVMKVEIIEGCISCGACESINSEVFHMNDIAHVNQDKVTGNEEDCSPLLFQLSFYPSSNY
jgi:ferredoxin